MTGAEAPEPLLLQMTQGTQAPMTSLPFDRLSAALAAAAKAVGGCFSHMHSRQDATAYQYICYQ